MKKGSRIYVAGHKGLVGSAILRKLKERGFSKLITRTHEELDLIRQDHVERFFEREKPEYVYLAAAKVGGIMANNTYKAEFIYDNLAIALNVIHSAYKYEVKKLLNLGSSCIYPKLCPQPMKEEYLLTASLEPTNEPYAIAKISAIKLVRYYNEQYGTNFISVMPTNLYGENDNFNLETSHVLPALIRKFYLARCLEQNDFKSIIWDFQKYPIGYGLDKKINSSMSDQEVLAILDRLGIHKKQEQTTVTLWGTGEVFREFLDVDDLADACLFLMENIEAEDMRKLCADYFVNVGAGEDIKLKDLAMLVKRVVGFTGEIDWDSTKPDGTPRKLLDVSKINKLGWKATLGFEEGIQKVYNWYSKLSSTIY